MNCISAQRQVIFSLKNLNFVLTCHTLNISRFIFQLLLPSLRYSHGSLLKKGMHSPFQFIYVLQLQYSKH